MPLAILAERSDGGARFWRGLSAVLATTAPALLVAALVGRAPPDFGERSVVAVLRDGGQHPVWTIRIAPDAHQIAVDSLRPEPPPAGMAYQLWLAGPGASTPQPLGLLPLSGRKVIAETPANIRLLAGQGELRVTLEPAVSTLVGAPDGPVLFRASLAGRS